jgi:hypothetical protein
MMIIKGRFTQPDKVPLGSAGHYSVYEWAELKMVCGLSKPTSDLLGMVPLLQFNVSEF